MPGEPDSEGRLIEADELAAEVAERVRGSEEDEAADSAGMAGGEHHGDCATVRVAGDVRLVEAEGVHAGGDSVGCGFEPRVEAGNALGLAHIEEVDGVDAGAVCEKIYILTPVSGRANQTVEQQERSSGPGALIVNLEAAHQDVAFFDVRLSPRHVRCPPFQSD